MGVVCDSLCGLGSWQAQSLFPFAYATHIVMHVCPLLMHKHWHHCCKCVDTMNAHVLNVGCG